MASATGGPPSLVHVQTLHPPTAGVRSWASLPHHSPYSPLLATATSDKSVNIWDMRDWKLLSTIAGGHKRSVRCVGWKDYADYSDNRAKRRRKEADGGDEIEGRDLQEQRKPVMLATGSFDANCGLWVWNREKANVNTEDALAVDGGQSRAVPGAFDDESGDIEQDFTRAGGGGDEGDEDEDWHFSTLLTGPDSEIKDLQFSPPHYGANLLATCSRDKSVWVWEEVEPEEWETVAVLSEHQGDVKCVAWLKGATSTKGELTRRLGKKINDGEAINVADDEDIVLGGRELLATGSYDDTIRLHHDDEAEGDWLTIAVLTGHDGTVWDLKFESHANLASYPEGTSVEEVVVDWAPRLMSCSDDMTIRLWKKKLSDKEREEQSARLAEVRQGQAVNNGDAMTATRQTGFASTRIPSVIRPPTSTEKWIENARLPSIHLRSIYAIDWSAQSGLVVSCGGDGVIAVYQEVADPAAEGPDVVMNGTSEQEETEIQIKKLPTQWKVVAVVEDAHEEYEINHVCWAPRRDVKRRDHITGGQDQGNDGEEYIVSTSDDGGVKIWRLPEALRRVIGLNGD